MTSVPGFLTKTFEIFSSPEYSDCCGWGSNGETIIIRKIEQFSKQVLPKYFKHSNFQSFVRQLNMYDFHKTIQDPHHGEFVHEYFRQNKPELLINIKRKANKPPEAGAGKAGKNAKQAAATSASSTAATGTATGSATTAGGKGGNANNTTGGKNTGGSLKAAPLHGNNNSLASSASLLNTNANANANVNPHSLSLNTLGGNSGNSGNSGNMSTMNALNTHYNTPLLMNSDTNINNMNLNIDDLGSEITDSMPYYVDEDPFPITNSSYSYSNTNNNNSLNNNNTLNSHTNYYDNYMTTLPEEIATETGGLMQELHQQRMLREQFERRMESKLAALQGENNMLKSMFMESHRKNAIMQERMERVMKTLYTMFVGGVGNGSNSPGMALTNKAPSMLLTDMQHFLQQQKSTSSSEIALLKEMEVDTHAASPPHYTSTSGMEYSGSGSSGSGSGSSGVGMFNGSGLRGGLGRPIVLGNGNGTSGTDTSGGMEVLGYDEAEHELRNNSNSAEDEENRLLRLDSATLGRLPSLDLDELQSLPSGYNNTNTTTATHTNNTNSNTNATNDTNTSANNAIVNPNDYYHHLLNRPLAGAALGDMKVTSFDIAASAVTAPSLQQQSSFDGAYLPIPDVYVPLMRNNSDTSGVSVGSHGSHNSHNSAGSGGSGGSGGISSGMSGVGINNHLSRSRANTLNTNNTNNYTNTGSSNTTLSAPQGRVFLQPSSSQLAGVQPLGSPAVEGRPPLSRTTATANTTTGGIGASIEGGVDGSGVGSGIGSGSGSGSGNGNGSGLPLLARQRTFDYTPVTERSSGLLHSVVDVVHGLSSVDSGHGSVGSTGSGGAGGSTGSAGVGSGDSKYEVSGKRKVDEMSPTSAANTTSASGSGSDGLVSPSKKLKGAWLQPEDSAQALSEAAALGNEDVHSSLNEAQQFMHLLQRNQQTTLTRLDSLEQTIACLFDGSDAPSSAAPSVTSSTTDAAVLPLPLPLPLSLSLQAQVQEGKEGKKGLKGSAEEARGGK